MTLTDIFEKYYGVVSKFFNTISVSTSELNKVEDKHTYIIINDLPNDAQSAFDMIFPIFISRKNGGTIFINEVSPDIMKIFLDKVRLIKDDKSTGVRGVSITHIKGVGYIIVTLCESDISSTQEYTLEEYMKLSERYILVGIAKQEEHYIKDWVAYHLRIGFDNIILYDNNDVFGESYDELLKEYVESGKLSIVNVRGKKGVQVNTYNSLYYSTPFKWCAYIDIDEYIWFNETGPYTNIKQFIESIPNEKSFGIMLQWHCYAGSGDDKPSDRPVWEVCNKPVPFNARKDCRHEYMNDWCKSIYKKGWPIAVNEHFGWYTQGSIFGLGVLEISSSGTPIYKKNLTYISEQDFNNQPVFVKHFLLRNINEFYNKKYMRGHAGLPGIEGIDGWGYYQWRQNMNYYTDITPVLTEKEQLFMNRQGMKVNYTFHPDVFVNLCIIPGNHYINNKVIDMLMQHVFPNVNALFTLTSIEGNGENLTIQQHSNSPTSMKGDLDFITRYVNNSDYLGIEMRDESKNIRQFIQEPVIINIGFPEHWAYVEVSQQEQDEYIKHLKCMFDWNNLKPIIRSALANNVSTFLKIGAPDNGECFGWVDTLNPWLKSIGLELPAYALTNNTYVMPYQSFLKYKQFQNTFVEKFGWAPNGYIIKNGRDNVSTQFHAFLSSMLSSIKNTYFVWPN